MRSSQYIGVKSGQRSFEPELLDRTVLRITSVSIVTQVGELVDNFDVDRVECTEERVMYRLSKPGIVVGYITFNLLDKNIEWNLNPNCVGRYIEFHADVTL